MRLLSRSRPSDVSDWRAFDLCSETTDPLAIKDCDAVIHLAAHIPRDHSDPAEAELCWKTNALGTLRLVEAMHKAGVPRLVQLTSANAYSPGLARPTEDDAMFPTGRIFYLASKVAQEIYARDLCEKTGIALATLRVSSVYGPGQHIGAISAISRRLASGERVVLENQGSFGADFVFVDDVCAALFLVIFSGACGAYNVGSGTRSTLADIAGSLTALIGADPKLIFRDGEVDEAMGFPALDICKISALGYRPTPLAEGLGMTLTAGD